MRTTFSLLYGIIVCILSITVQADIRVSPFETVRLGPYAAQNCKSNNQHLSNVLLSLHGALEPVLHDLESNRSSAAYTTFFKNVAYAPYVRKIFSEVWGPVAVNPEPDEPPSIPIFVCIDGPPKPVGGRDIRE
ncbi:hypothetical protein G7Y79_00057g090980 [Physcia stellaris]|nr:hypothetical protein G7Y79_00057g090980 [Physcia stellaris]